MPFPAYVKSVDKFGTGLFKSLHAASPGRNVVFSPIGISSAFAALREGSWDTTIREELNRAFAWDAPQKLGLPHRMLIARFETPLTLTAQERRERGESRARKWIGRFDEFPAEITAVLKEVEGGDSGFASPEEFWISSSLLYHGDKAIKFFSEDFLFDAKRNFGLELKDASESGRGVSEFSDVRFPAVTESDRHEFLNFWLNTIVHLRTRWSGNTFLLHELEKGDFFASPGTAVPVTMMPSEFELYPYAKTDKFEAVVLSAENADMTVILPREGTDIYSLDNSLAQNPRMLSAALKRRAGDVKLPQFDFVFEATFREFLERMGVHKVFNDLDNIAHTIPPSRLLGVSQRASISVDREGIRADAGTVAAGVLGGVMEGEREFHMIVNRPFLFQVRDNITGMLLFMGVVINPSRH